MEGGQVSWVPSHQERPPVPAACQCAEPAAGLTEKRDRVGTRWQRRRHAPLHLSPECDVTQDIGRWQRKVKGKTHSYLWRGHLLSDQKQRPNLRKFSSCTRADGEVCAMLSSVQLSIYYYSASPDPASKADICPSSGARSPGTGRCRCPLSEWVVSSATWFVAFCVRREGSGEIQNGEFQKGNKRKIPAQENCGLNGNGLGLEIWR